MTVQIYSTVLYFRELLAWYKNGYKMFRAKENKALKSRLINDFNKSDIDDLINTIQYMDFIEDYEVVVVTFESEIAKSNSLDLEIKFQSLQDIYAITDRGLRMLSSGRMPKLIKLEKTLPKEIKKEVEKLIDAREIKNLLRGASFLYKISAECNEKKLKDIFQDDYDLNNKKLLEKIFKTSDDIETILRNLYFCLKDEDDTSSFVLNKDSKLFNLVYNMFHYVRRNPKIPETHFGYFFDLGIIVSETLNKSREKNPIIDQYRQSLNSLYKEKPWLSFQEITSYLDLSELLTLDPAFEVLSPLSIILFIIIKISLFDSNYNPLSIFPESSLFKKNLDQYISFREDFLTASFFTGFYCGFNHFYSDYYLLQDAPIFHNEQDTWF